MKDFRELQVWEKAHRFTLECYRATAKFPTEEKYGLASQLRRAAAAIPTNIAEGCGRRGNGEFHRFLQIAMGSATETDYHLLLAHDLGYLRDDAYRGLNAGIDEIKKMLSSLIRKVDAERAAGAGA